MSVEQRVRAYYKRHAQGWRNSRYGDGSPFSIYLQIARVFKLPIRQVREILGKHPSKPPWPGLPKGCVHEEDGYCSGRVTWYWDRSNETWESRCSTHYPGWERWLRHPRYEEVMEERIKRGLERNRTWNTF